MTTIAEGRSTTALARAAAWTTIAAIPAVGTALALAAWHVLHETSWSHWAVADALAVAAGAVGAAAAFNLTLCIALELARASSSTVRRRVRNLPTPTIARALAAAATGSLLVATAGAPALASDHGVGWSDGEPPVTQPASTPESHREMAPASSLVAWGTARSGDAPAEPNAPASIPVASASPAPRTVTVERGDSLWRITEAVLGGDVSDATIASAWPQLYAANQALIGAKPHLIHPGQVLTIPEGFAS